MTHGTGRGRRLEVSGLARVEGAGSLRIAMSGDSVTDVALDIFEAPRYFEALLAGRSLAEAPDITARICGICPVAYQLTACAAMEAACGVSPDQRVWALRRLLYCGEWISSHALHVYLLHAPDFLGCADAVELASRDRTAVRRGLDLKRTGNLILETVGGRAIHPVNVRLGGFYRAPSRPELSVLVDPLRRALDAALDTVRWVAGFTFPDVTVDYLFVALRDPGRYPIERGSPASSDGLDVTAAEYAALLSEDQAPHSTARRYRLPGRGPYLTGPLARYALNSARLPAVAADAAAAAGLGPVCRNPFQSIVVRAVELVTACWEALNLVESYEPPDPPAIPVRPDPGAAAGVTASGATEAPRGLLLHTYGLDRDGIITAARIVPPTAQNQLTIEADLRRVAEAAVHLGDDELRSRCETAVRNHDPCISCATHFLDVEVERG